MSTAISPLASPFPDMPQIAGVTPRVARAQYKPWDRCDLTFISFDAGTTVAGVTTQSKCPSPEVEWCRAHLAAGVARGLVVSAGNANAFTGHKGRAAVEAVTAKAFKSPLDKANSMLLSAMRRCKVSTNGMLSSAAPCWRADKVTPSAVAHRLNLAKGVSGRWYTKWECRPCQNSPRP